MGVAVGVVMSVAVGVAMGVAVGVAVGVAMNVVMGVAMGVATQNKVYNGLSSRPSQLCTCTYPYCTMEEIYDQCFP